MKEPHAVLKRYARQRKPVELDKIALPQRLEKPLRVAACAIMVEKKKPPCVICNVGNEDIRRHQITMNKAQLMQFTDFLRQSL